LNGLGERLREWIFPLVKRLCNELGLAAAAV